MRATAAKIELARLQARWCKLLAMLPGDLSALADLDADQLSAAFADAELISAEMMVISDAQLAILDELDRCP
jgi:hypothetical protein